MNILVTGGSGYIGSNLIKYLENKNHEVFNYDSLTGHNILDMDDLKTVFRNGNFDEVYHLAAQAYVGNAEANPYNDLIVNAHGLINLLKLLEKYNIPLLFSSTGAVYGLGGPIPHKEDNYCLPTSNYGISKLAAEKYLQKWVITEGIDAKIVRFSSIYGLGRKHGPVNIFINQALKGGPITVYSGGRHTRDLLHIDDTLRAIELVMERGSSGEAYNVAYGKEYSIMQVARMVQRNISVSIENVKHELSLYDLARDWHDISKIKSLGFEPQIDLDQGIKLLIFQIQEGIEI